MSVIDQLFMREADLDDVELLCDLNEKLRRDEQAQMQLTRQDLVARLRGWMTEEGYRGVLFEIDGRAIAYALFRTEPDPCMKDGQIVYLRQLYVEHAYRRLGVGSEAMRRWREVFVPAGMPVELDVLERNESGRAFWKAIGMMPRMTRMRR